MRGRDCVAGTCTMGFCGTNPCVPFGSDTFGYTGCSFTPASLPCPDISATGTSLSLGDDGEATVTIPFSFDYYGTGRTSVTVGSNGALAFDSMNVSFINTCMPLAGTPFELIAAFWDDLNTGPAGAFVRHDTVGTAPNRRFVVNWNNEHLGGMTGDNIDVTVVLNETTNHIDICYADTTVGRATLDFGMSATAGISGSAANSVQFSCNMPSLTTGLLVRYLHP